MSKTEAEIFEFTCPNCGGHDLVKNSHPVIAREHYKGIDKETGELLYDGMTWGIESRGGKRAIKYGGEVESFFDCYACEYRPQRVCGEDDEYGEPGELMDIETDEDMVKWLQDRSNTVAISVLLVESEKEEKS